MSLQKVTTSKAKIMRTTKVNTFIIGCFVVIFLSISNKSWSDTVLKDNFEKLNLWEYIADDVMGGGGQCMKVALCTSFMRRPGGCARTPRTFARER